MLIFAFAFVELCSRLSPTLAISDACCCKWLMSSLDCKNSATV